MTVEYFYNNLISHIPAMWPIWTIGLSLLFFGLVSFPFYGKGGDDRFFAFLVVCLLPIGFYFLLLGFLISKFPFMVYPPICWAGLVWGCCAYNAIKEKSLQSQDGSA